MLPLQTFLEFGSVLNKQKKKTNEIKTQWAQQKKKKCKYSAGTLLANMKQSSLVTWVKQKNCLR